MGRQFEVKDVLDTLEEVVAEAGREYEYPDSHRMHANTESMFGTPMCRYVWYDETTNKPQADCIVARVYVKLHGGEFTEWTTFREFDGVDAQPWIDEFTEEALAILNSAQSIQDRGEGEGPRTWGTALDVAKEHAENGVEW